MRPSTLPISAVLVAVALGAAACTSILGNDFEITPGPATGGSAATSTSTQGGGGATSTTSTGGMGGTDPCGNGMPDPGETCDGDCPTECFDPDQCTEDILMGSPDTCDVMCSFEPQVTCRSNDGCCPTGCQQGNDNDCNLRILVLGTDDNSISLVGDAIDGSGEFMTAVGRFNGRTNPVVATTLAGYHAVFALGNLSFLDKVATGDLLADFYDNGGRVVTANGVNCLQFNIEGRWLDDGYFVFDLGNANPNMDTMVIDEPMSPLLAGVSTLGADLHCDHTPKMGSTVVASYMVSGDPAVVRGEFGGRKRVDLNFFPIGNLVTGDWLPLLINALKYQ